MRFTEIALTGAFLICGSLAVSGLLRCKMKAEPLSSQPLGARNSFSDVT